MHACIDTTDGRIWAVGESGPEAIEAAAAAFRAETGLEFPGDEFIAPLAEDDLAAAVLAGAKVEWKWTAGEGSSVTIRPTRTPRPG